eukprot:gene9640-32222_t
MAGEEIPWEEKLQAAEVLSTLGTGNAAAAYGRDAASAAGVGAGTTCDSASASVPAPEGEAWCGRAGRSAKNDGAPRTAASASAQAAAIMPKAEVASKPCARRKCDGCGTMQSHSWRYTAEGRDGTDQVANLYCSSCFLRYQRSGAKCPQCAKVHSPGDTKKMPARNAACLGCTSDMGDWKAELARREAVLGRRHTAGGKCFEDF